MIFTRLRIIEITIYYNHLLHLTLCDTYVLRRGRPPGPRYHPLTRFMMRVILFSRETATRMGRINALRLLRRESSLLVVARGLSQSRGPR